MKKLYFTMIIAVVCNSLISLYAQEPADIIRKSHDAVRISSFEAVATLTIDDGKGNERIRKNTMASKTYPDKTEKRIIKFIAPPEVEGTGILIFDHEEQADDMWIYLPALRKTRRIVSSEKSKSFMGSEFSNADMSAPPLEDFTYELTGSEDVDGTSCWKIRSVPRDMELEDEYGYSSAVSWIGKNDYIIRRSDYFDFDGSLIKRINTLEFNLLEPESGKYMVTDMVAENFRNGRSSRMKMERIEVAATNDNYFTVSYLER